MNGVMKFGAFNLFQHPEAAKNPEAYWRELEDELRQIELAEELGFDSVWLAEHHFSDYGMASDAMLLAGHVAARTKRVRIGTAVNVLPFHHPIRLAEQVAAVDALSGGRLDHGVGRGYQPYEYAGFGIPMEESRARFNECLDVMIKAWTESKFSYEGKYFRFQNVSVFPKPRQRPFPPLLIASVSDETIISTAKRGLPMLTGQVFMPFPQTHEKTQLYLRSLNEAGHGQQKINELLARSGYLRFVYVAETDKQARVEAGTALLNYMTLLGKYTLPPFATAPATFKEHEKPAEERARLTLDEMWDTCLIFGTPDRCIRKIEELRGFGVQNLLCWMVFGGLEHRKVVRSMKLFAKEVMPHFQKAPALPRR